MEFKSKVEQLLDGIAKVFGAKEHIKINHCQISGVSYLNIGDAGVEFLDLFVRSGAKVKAGVCATCNPSGLDRLRWKQMGIDETFYRKQKKVLDLYEQMGVSTICSCTPYHAGFEPAVGEHVAWSESSAVTYANSVLGARTNREGAVVSLSSAIAGYVPMYGLHIDDNRVPEMTVAIDYDFSSSHEYGALGEVVGRRAGGKVVLIKSNFEPSRAGLKALSASLPTYSSIDLFHWEGVTPECRRWPAPADEIIITAEDVTHSISRIGGRINAPSVVFLGCPHLGIEEIERISEIIEGKRVRVPLMLFTCQQVLKEAEERGVTSEIYNAGAEIYCDTCPVVSPIGGRFSTVLTDSAKACYYLKGIHGCRVGLDSVDRCIEVATS